MPDRKLGYVFRPYGDLDWILRKIPIKKWSMLGCVATEERALATYGETKEVLSAEHSCFLRIKDPMPLDQDEIERLWKLRIATAGLPEKRIVDVDLLSAASKVLGMAAQTLVSRNLIVDISSLPKRIFFLFLKEAIKSDAVSNLVVTYALPETYPEKVIASNPQPWKALPGFDNDFSDSEASRSVVLGIGYLPIGLSDLLSGEVRDLNVLFPFPPASPAYNRNWDYLRELGTIVSSRLVPIRISAFDAPEVFEFLAELCDHGGRRSLLLPYGPKPMSLAMCLYACAAARRGRELTSVYYAQPQTYITDYSIGVQRSNRRPKILAYPIKIGGRFLYELP